MGGGVSDNCTKTTRKRHYLSLKPALQAHSPHSGFALYSIPVLLSPRQRKFQLRLENFLVPGPKAKAPARFVRLPSVSRGFGTRGGSGATGWRFRRNGIAVPAQRHHRSGATGRRFRRNGVAVPAQRGHRSGATAGARPLDGPRCALILPVHVRNRPSTLVCIFF